MTFLTHALAYIFAPFLLIGANIGTALAPEQETLGASDAIPTTIAFFETTLASAITSSATSFTLTSATDADGTTLASSTYAFVIDEGSSNEEIVLADCTGTVCTNAERGISVRTGNTEVTALKKAHRRGASVKITDAPILMLVARALRGESIVSFTPDSGNDLVTKTYVDSLALGSTTVAASETDDGIGELATGVEAASSTPIGNSGSPLFLHTGISTSTVPTTGYVIPITKNNGKVDGAFLDFNDIVSVTTLSATGTSIWTKPSNGSFAFVELWGGGGGGGNGDTYEGGGGGGGYANKLYQLSELSATTSYTIGGGGATGNPGSAGGTTTFGTLNAYGGGGGAVSGASANAEGGGSGGFAGVGGTAVSGVSVGAAGSPGSPMAGAGGDEANGAGGMLSGGGGGGNTKNGGGAYYGGGGGASSGGTGGTSLYGGGGGNSSTSGTVPGGGGGGNGGNGARGQIRITIW